MTAPTDRLLHAACSTTRRRRSATRSPPSRSSTPSSIGFGRAWVAQHHFHAAEGGLPSPFVFLAHVAAPHLAHPPRHRRDHAAARGPGARRGGCRVVDLLSAAASTSASAAAARPSSFVAVRRGRARQGADVRPQARACCSTRSPVATSARATRSTRMPATASPTASGRRPSRRRAVIAPACTGTGCCSRARSRGRPDALHAPLVRAAGPHHRRLPRGAARRRRAAHHRLAHGVRRRRPRRGAALRRGRACAARPRGSAARGRRSPATTIDELIVALDTHLGTPERGRRVARRRRHARQRHRGRLPGALGRRAARARAALDRALRRTGRARARLHARPTPQPSTHRPARTGMTTDIVDQIAGVTPELDALRRRRPVTREQLQASFDALFQPGARPSTCRRRSAS